MFKPAYQNRKGVTVDPFQQLQDFLQKVYRSSDPEEFIKHYFDNYKNPKNPPSWMAMELVTIGGLSRLYSNLAKKEDKNLIAKAYNLPSFVFQSWFHAIRHLRNLSAHHCRIWNREYRIVPQVLKKSKYNWIDPKFNINNRTFYYLNILKYFLNIINPSNTFRNKLEELLNKHSNVDIRYLGLPTDKKNKLINWKSQPLWKK